MSPIYIYMQHGFLCRFYWQLTIGNVGLLDIL